MPFLVNFVAFQLGWFACVLGGARGLPWVGVAMIAAVIAVHLWQSPRIAPELRLLAFAALVGTTWESLLAATGILVYPSGQVVSWLAPVWIVALWIGFATSFNVTMRWMRGRLPLAALVGGIFGPVSFAGGARLGAVEVPDPVLGYAALSMGWAVLLPTMVTAASRFDGWPPVEIVADSATVAADAAEGRDQEQQG